MFAAGKENDSAVTVCDAQEYLANWTVFISSHLHNRSKQQDAHDMVKFYMADVAVPAICAFGILGNILNLIVLAQKQLQSSMDRLEKSAHLGLVALAVSDMLFCILAFISAFWPHPLQSVGTTGHVLLIFTVYRKALLNILLFSSTWLTVVMATGRYLAICHPLHTRSFINLCGTRAAIAVVFIGSILINLPYFWEMTIFHYPCPMIEDFAPGVVCDCYMSYPGTLFRKAHFKTAYIVTWAVLGTFLPIIILAVCNICLIQALRRSQRMQRMYRANQPRDSGHRITPTLITIIILFIILVCPSEVLKFFQAMGVKPDKPDQLRTYMSATYVANFMVATNFAINFILYCAINVHFRHTIANLLTCRWYRQRRLDYKNSQHTYTSNMSEAETEMQMMEMKHELNNDSLRK